MTYASATWILTATSARTVKSHIEKWKWNAGHKIPIQKTIKYSLDKTKVVDIAKYITKLKWPWRQKKETSKMCI